MSLAETIQIAGIVITLLTMLVVLGINYGTGSTGLNDLRAEVTRLRDRFDRHMEAHTEDKIK